MLYHAHMYCRGLARRFRSRILDIAIVSCTSNRPHNDIGNDLFLCAAARARGSKTTSAQETNVQSRRSPASATGGPV